MPFYLRKSISAGPFRLNLSKHGMGLSFGVKGLRIGSGPRGNYVHLGRRGIYYRASLGTKKHGDSSEGLPISTEAEAELSEVETGSVLDLKPASSRDIVAQLNEKMSLISVWPFVVILGLSACIYIYLNDFNQYYIISCVVAFSVLASISAYRDRIRRTVVVMYDLEDTTALAFSSFCAAFEKLADSSKIWSLDTVGEIRDWKRNFGAREQVKRTPASFAYSTPRVLKTNIDIPAILGGKNSIYFLPDVILFIHRSHMGALAYKQVKINWAATRFAEEGVVPKDSIIVGSTWKYVNRNGGPDRRFKNNKQIPEVVYQVMTLEGPDGFQKILHLSKMADTTEFDSAFRRVELLNDQGAEYDAGKNEIEFVSRTSEPKKLIWHFLQPQTDKPNSVSVYAECPCGNKISCDDEWKDDARVVCANCGTEFGSYGEFKKKAADALQEFIKAG